MIDISFNSSSDFVCVIPIFCSTDGFKINTQVFLRIDIKYTSAWRRITRIIALALPAIFSGNFVLNPFDFWIHKLISYKIVFSRR